MASPRPTDLLRDAIDAARSALRDLDADEVPAKVRRVKASSERTLPPPLATSLLRELSLDEFLREKALDAWDGERPPDSGPAAAAYAFLAREPGWETVVVAEALALGERHGVASDRSGEVERDALVAELTSLKEQLKRSREEAAATERALRTALDEVRAPGRADRRGEQKAREALEAERVGWAERETELLAAIESLEADVTRFKEVARQARSDRADIAAALEAGGGGGLPSDPVELARLLDDVAAHAMAIAPVAETAASAADTPDAPLPGLDASLRPDRAEAIEWLATVGPVTVLVDGYNLGFALAGLEAERARAVAVEAAGRLGATSTGLGVVVVFDSSIEPLEAELGDSGRVGAITVVFTEGEIADDAIVARACAEARVVVITNDRELRQRSEACGAVALWSDALVEWSRRR